jgi:hypothetical protein
MLCFHFQSETYSLAQLTAAFLSSNSVAFLKLWLRCKEKTPAISEVESGTKAGRALGAGQSMRAIESFSSRIYMETGRTVGGEIAIETSSRFASGKRIEAWVPLRSNGCQASSWLWGLIGHNIREYFTDHIITMNPVDLCGILLIKPVTIDLDNVPIIFSVILKTTCALCPKGEIKLEGYWMQSW